MTSRGHLRLGHAHFDVAVELIVDAERGTHRDDLACGSLHPDVEHETRGRSLRELLT